MLQPTARAELGKLCKDFIDMGQAIDEELIIQILCEAIRSVIHIAIGVVGASVIVAECFPFDSNDSVNVEYFAGGYALIPCDFHILQ